jgi:hypothetical protein
MHEADKPDFFVDLFGRLATKAMGKVDEQLQAIIPSLLARPPPCQFRVRCRRS